MNDWWGRYIHVSECVYQFKNYLEKKGHSVNFFVLMKISSELIRAVVGLRLQTLRSIMMAQMYIYRFESRVCVHREYIELFFKWMYVVLFASMWTQSFARSLDDSHSPHRVWRSFQPCYKTKYVALCVAQWHSLGHCHIQVLFLPHRRLRAAHNSKSNQLWLIKFKHIQ